MHKKLENYTSVRTYPAQAWMLLPTRADTISISAIPSKYYKFNTCKFIYHSTDLVTLKPFFILNNTQAINP